MGQRKECPLLGPPTALGFPTSAPPGSAKFIPQTSDKFLPVPELQFFLNTGHREWPGTAEYHGRMDLSFFSLECRYYGSEPPADTQCWGEEQASLNNSVSPPGWGVGCPLTEPSESPLIQADPQWAPARGCSLRLRAGIPRRWWILQ